MSHEITGTTRHCFVLADPVGHLRTPQVLNRVWEERGLDIVTVPGQVTAAGLPDLVAALRVTENAVGAIVTVPHKQTMLALCDELGPNAQIVGAVNVVRRTAEGRLIGETFDGLGFVAGLRAAGFEPHGQRSIVLGAGGAASAVAVALLSAGVQALDVGNRTRSRADELVTRLRDAFPGRDIGVGLDRAGSARLIVNGTSSGLSSSDESPIAAELIPAGALAADVVMSAERTPFLTAAAARGAHTLDGSAMLTGQIQLIADFLST